MSLRIKSQAAIYNSNLSLGIYPVAYRFTQSLFTTLYNVGLTKCCTAPQRLTPEL